MTVEKQWYEKATTYAVSTEIYLPFSNYTVESLFYFYLPCFHRYCLDETLHHGYIKKMVIISQRSLSRFRDVKNIFFALFKGKRCNSWKHTIPCYTEQVVKISLSCSTLYQISPILQQPSVSKRGDGDISISSIYCSQNTSQPNIVKKYYIFFFQRILLFW